MERTVRVTKLARDAQGVPRANLNVDGAQYNVAYEDGVWWAHFKDAPRKHVLPAFAARLQKAAYESGVLDGKPRDLKGAL